VPWPAAEATLPLQEALRIVLLEGTVHLLDVLHAVGDLAGAPANALRESAALLAEIAPAIEFIDAATGRSPTSPLPVLR
jgi:hypothetical protein